jgi:hypothetical protein
VAERLDIDALLGQIDIVEVVGSYVHLKRKGAEFVGLCPFHDDKSPSMYVSPVKRFAHCFGCGAHHDAIGFLMRHLNLGFREAAEKALGRDLPNTVAEPPPARASVEQGENWVALLPAPESAPELMADGGWTVPIFNPKPKEGHPNGRMTRFKPSRADAYRDAQGRLLGYVLRCEFQDGKITPTITWCVGPDGAQQWCIRPFPRPRPLFGLDRLAARPEAPVLLVEGEKCGAAGAGALPMYAALSWPGGSKGIPYVDWSPLKGRDVVLWPDADQPGVQAMLGHEKYTGERVPGVAQFLARVGVRSMRFIDTAGQPKGWDIADAVADAWTPRQIAAWAATRVLDLEVRAA